MIGRDVIPPFRDEVQLTVEEYRNKLYEVGNLVTNRNRAAVVTICIFRSLGIPSCKQIPKHLSVCVTATDIFTI